MVMNKERWPIVMNLNRAEPNVAAGFDSRGFIYLKSAQWDLAISDYNSALRLDPKLPTSLYGDADLLSSRKAKLLVGSRTLQQRGRSKHDIEAEYASYGVR